MKLLALAVASIVDANTNQGYTRQYIGHSSAQVADHIERGRKIRSKSVVGLFTKLSGLLSKVVENAKAKAKNQKGVEQLLRMNQHQLRDIGLNYGDVESLRSGQLSLDDLAARRQSDRVPTKSMSGIGKTTINASIRKIESANQDCFEHAKCS
jgi:uncharacterized protein YjiS (DUF1127 family)